MKRADTSLFMRFVRADLKHSPPAENGLLKMTEILKILTGIYAEFPKLMKAELGFAQLTATEPS
jgi:hypothetical protein